MHNPLYQLNRVTDQCASAAIFPHNSFRFNPINSTKSHQKKSRGEVLAHRPQPPLSPITEYSHNTYVPLNIFCIAMANADRTDDRQIHGCFGMPMHATDSPYTNCNR